MPSLDAAMKKMKIPSAERELIQNYAEKYRSEGFNASESNKKAVEDMIRDLDEEYQMIVSQLRPKETIA